MIDLLLNWSKLSRYITGGNRNSLRPGKIPVKHWPRIDKLIYEELPAWWEKKKKEL